MDVAIIKLLPLLLAWCLDLIFGDPARLPHLIVGFGKSISFFEHRLNSGQHRMAKGLAWLSDSYCQHISQRGCSSVCSPIYMDKDGCRNHYNILLPCRDYTYPRSKNGIQGPRPFARCRTQTGGTHCRTRHRAAFSYRNQDCRTRNTVGKPERRCGRALVLVCPARCPRNSGLQDGQHS